VKVLCVLGRHAYGDPARGEGYEHANFLPALAALGHETHVFDSLDRTAYRDFAELNEAFLSRVEAVRPDAILCVLMHYEIWLESLDRVRARYRVPIINWGTDDSWKYEQFARFVAPHVDLYVTTSKAAFEQASREGLENVVLSQWGADGEALAEPLPARECRYPVSFVGAAYGNRRKWIGTLAARGVKVHCFGHGWPDGPVLTADVRRIARESVVSLNFGDSGVHWRGLLPYRSRQIKARIFEVPASGGFLMTEPAEALADCFRIGEEIEVFGSPDEAAAKIQRYLANQELRDRVARAGQERTRREHTYAQRFSRLLDEAVRRTCIRGLVARIDLPSVERAESYAIPWWMRLLRALLVVPATALFGVHRGPRAVRRLIFELSWRVAGPHTYSARGWPGRLFYRES
jgi:spore maturation protein CgeB